MGFLVMREMRTWYSDPKSTQITRDRKQLHLVHCTPNQRLRCPLKYLVSTVDASEPLLARTAPPGVDNRVSVVAIALPRIHAELSAPSARASLSLSPHPMERLTAHGLKTRLFPFF